MKYTIRERCKNLVVIDFETGGDYKFFIEIYRSGVMYSDIICNGDIKLIRKALRIANRERIKLFFMR